MVNKPWASIIVPTLSDDPPVLMSLPPLEELARDGIELIVVRDRGWRNASRTRNIGAAAARGRVLCFIDDDASLNYRKLLDLLRHVSEMMEVLHMRLNSSTSTCPHGDLNEY